MRQLAPILTLTTLLGSAVPVRAQQDSVRTELIGQIVAVVGDSIITNFDMDEELIRYQADNRQPLPPEGPERDKLRKQLLDNMINQLVLLQEAQRDTSIHIQDQDVNSQVDGILANYRRAYGGDIGFQQALRQSDMTLAKFRDDLLSRTRSQILLRDYMQKVMRDRKPPPVTEREMRDYFEANKAQWGERPATVSFAQVVIPVMPSDTADSTAVRTIREIMAKVKQKVDFAQLAREYSQDPGTRDRGGDLGWFSAGKMLPGFDHAVFSMLPGEVRGPVRTSYGYHVIKLLKVRGGERQASHILIRPTITDEDVNRARALADTVVMDMKNGANVDSLAKKYGDPEEDVHVGPLLADSIPDPYGAQLSGAKVGTVVGPLPLMVGNQPQKFMVARVTETLPAGEYTLDDPRLRTRLQQQIAQDKLANEIIDELRQKTYIAIRSP